MYVPDVYWDYTRQNVLVMERIHGIPVTDMVEVWHALEREARDAGLGRLLSDEQIAEYVRRAMWFPSYETLDMIKDKKIDLKPTFIEI